MASREDSAGRDQLTPREVAERTGFSYHSILRAIKRGELQACEPIPGRLRIEVSEYERWRTAPTRSRIASGGEAPRRPRRRGGDRGGFAAELRAIEGGA